MSKAKLTVNADLDVPGETRRQTAVFGIWFLCLALAVVVTASRRPTSSNLDTPIATPKMDVYQRERILFGAGLGLLLPAILTWWITHRRRRGGPHARGIVIDITDDGELRVWGRGYGQRIAVSGAEITERLVDVYTGRLGAWRQRRLIIRTKRPIPGMPSELALATPATDEDDDLDLPLIGGEGDCIEMPRGAYLQVLETTRALSAPDV
jgi:hypothetical protein